MKKAADSLKAKAMPKAKAEKAPDSPKAKAIPKTSTGPSKAPTTMDFSTQELRMVRFGKHKGTSCELMMVEQKSYCEWVIQTYEIEDKSSDPALIHFATYLLEQGFNGRKPMKEMDEEWDQEL